MPKFVMFVKGDPKPGFVPSQEDIEPMVRYNEDLQKAGVLLDLNGLHPSANGARVNFASGQPTVIDGPFTESKELVAGYWVIQTKSMEEAIEWAKRAPMAPDDRFEGDPVIEIRQIFELDEFGEGPGTDRARELEKELSNSKE
ncbi:MAG: YciI family protein [Actinomycetota bacterium]